MVRALTVVLYVFPVTRLNVVCALSLQILLTFCALFFLCFTKARRNFAQVQVFPGMHGSFLHFCKGGRNFAQGSH